MLFKYWDFAILSFNMVTFKLIENLGEPHNLTTNKNEYEFAQAKSCNQSEVAITFTAWSILTMAVHFANSKLHFVIIISNFN